MSWVCCCCHYFPCFFVAQELSHLESMPCTDKNVRSNGVVSGMSNWLWHLYVGEGLPLQFYCGCLWRKSMHFNEVECFYYFRCICTRSILQNYTWIQWRWLMYEVYIFRFIRLPLDKATTRCSHLGALLCLWQVRYSRIQHRQGWQLFRYS